MRQLQQLAWEHSVSLHLHPLQLSEKSALQNHCQLEDTLINIKLKTSMLLRILMIGNKITTGKETDSQMKFKFHLLCDNCLDPCFLSFKPIPTLSCTRIQFYSKKHRRRLRAKSSKILSTLNLFYHALQRCLEVWISCRILYFSIISYIGLRRRRFAWICECATKKSKLVWQVKNPHWNNLSEGLIVVNSSRKAHQTFLHSN